MKQLRLPGIDLLRIASVLMIFFFHANQHLQCTFGIATNFVIMGATAMTAFFILSGFCLAYAHPQIITNVKGFYFRRFTRIYPLYLFMYISSMFAANSPFTLAHHLLLMPVQLTLTQSWFSTLFGYTPNLGCWFISCLATCYFIFPMLIRWLDKQTSTWKLWLIMLGLIAYEMLSNQIVREFVLGTFYASSFMRGIEFLIGVLLCKIVTRPNAFQSLHKHPYLAWLIAGGSLLLMAVLIDLMVRSEIAVHDYMFYTVVVLPLLIPAIAALAQIRSWHSRATNAVIGFLVRISFAFFCASIFSFNLCKKIIATYPLSNRETILVAFVINTLIALLIHYLIEQPGKLLCEKLKESLMRHRAQHFTTFS